MNGSLKSPDKTFDVAALGEVLIDFTEAGRSPDGMRLFEQNPGGAPANMLSGVARLGGQAAFIGKAGADMHGRFLQDTLKRVGVDTGGLLLAHDVFTTLAFVALSGGERAFSFARKPGADTCLRPEEVNQSILEKSKIFHVGSLSLTAEPSRSATYFALKHAKAHGCVISYDPNYRASLWNSEAEAAAQMKGPLEFVDVMKLSDEETALLTGCGDPEQAAQALCSQGIKIVAVTLGKAGALVCIGGRCRTVPGYDIPAVDTTGAGDAFWSGFLYRLIQSGKAPAEVTLEEAAAFARFGNATATVCVTRRGGIPAMPTLDEVTVLMEEN